MNIEATLQQYLPLIQQKLSEAAGDGASKLATIDDATLTTWLEGTHELLPLPVRLLLRRDTFVDLCISKRHLLVAPLLKESIG